MISSSVIDGDTDIRKQIGARPPGDDRQVQPATGPNHLKDRPTSVPSRQQQEPVQATPLGGHHAGHAWLKTRNDRRITADEKFDTQLPTLRAAVAASSRGTDAGHLVDRKQTFGDPRTTGCERNITGVALRPQSCYPPPSVSELQQQLLHQMQTRQQPSESNYQAPRDRILGVAAVASSGVPRAGVNRLPRSAIDGKNYSNVLPISAGIRDVAHCYLVLSSIVSERLQHTQSRKD